LASASEQKPDLSVILPVRNEADHLGPVLDALLSQTLAPHRFEILVVDGRSSDATRDVVSAQVAGNPHLHLLDNPGCLSSCARNIGARHARGRYLLFIDGHCRIESPALLEHTLTAFAEGNACLSRPQDFLRDCPAPFPRAAGLARSSWLGHQVGSRIYRHQAHHCSPLSAGCGYAKDLFDSLGGFDESFDACEDLEFNWRVAASGMKALHRPEFAVSYFPRGTFGGLFRQLYRYGFGRARMVRKHPRFGSFLAGLPALFCLLLLGLPLAAFALPFLWLIWGGLVLGYLATIGVVAAHLAARHGRKLFPALQASFVAIHLGAGLGFLSGLAGGPSWAHAPPQRAPLDSCSAKSDCS